MTKWPEVAIQVDSQNGAKKVLMFRWGLNGEKIGKLVRFANLLADEQDKEDERDFPDAD